MSSQQTYLEIENQVWVESQMECLDFVDWDRFTLSNWANHQGVTAYGWIDRDDGYKDFVVVIFWPANRDLYYVTSSDTYSEEIYRRLHDDDPEDGHGGCRRIEDWFDVENAIELEETMTRTGAVEPHSVASFEDHVADYAHDAIDAGLEPVDVVEALRTVEDEIVADLEEGSR